jgi:probable rRNA maturation factor
MKITDSQIADSRFHSRRRHLHVVVTDARGRPLSAQGLAAWLERAGPARARGVVNIALVSDRTMRRLNRRYRGVDKITDVLSFPAAPDHPRSGAFLGDLAIATGLAGRQARRLGHSTAKELRILALHGLLHLLGYDHQTDLGAMRRLEERLRQRAGLPVGLIGRAGRAGSR